MGKFQQLASWLHGRVEPLCHLDDGPLDMREQIMIYNMPGCSAYTRQEYSEWLESEKASGFEATEDQERIARGRLTWLNRIGIASWEIFSFGTECQCCWGYRAIFVAALWFVFGLFIGVMI